MAGIDYAITSNTVLYGTKVSVDTGDNLTYTELLNELTNQPYLFKGMSIFADTISQVSQKVKITKKTNNGFVFTDLDYPRVDPMQRQFVINGINLNYVPSPINSINYTLEANQTVALWFFYEHKELVNYRTNQTTENNIKVPQMENKVIKKEVKKNVVIPMFGIIDYQPNFVKPTLKEAIKKMATFKNNDEVSEDEVFNSFSGSDFKEIE